MKNFNNIYVLIPVFNEEKIIEETINNLKVYFDHILIINDGSTDKTSAILENLDVIKINHPINLGQGAAIKTGIEYILKFSNADAVVTFDADGQHSVDDTILFAEKITTISEKYIISTRLWATGIPGARKITINLQSPAIRKEDEELPERLQRWRLYFVYG